MREVYARFAGRVLWQPVMKLKDGHRDAEAQRFSVRRRSFLRIQQSVSGKPYRFA